MKTPPCPFSAILLAGGKSTRMGCDKAALMFGGAPLWRQQSARLRALSPAEVLISGPLDGPWRDAGLAIVPDAHPGLGPLGGLATALAVMRSERALVLAVDMPAMTAAFLGDLLRACRENRGLVPRLDSHFEPLAAIYPRTMQPLALDQIASGDLSLQRWIRGGIDAGILDAHPIPAGERRVFQSLNTPAELAALLQTGAQ